MNTTHLFWAHTGFLNLPRYKKLLKAFGSLEAARPHFSVPMMNELGFEDPERVPEVFTRAREFDVRVARNRLDDLGARLLFMEDDVYPEPLRHIKDQPVYLFVRGQIPPLHKAMAVVGTRKMTSYGQFATQKLTAGLVGAGYTIVSGMAMGVDACAHQAALRHGGHTLAVLGSGIDNLSPSRNRWLGEAILKSGGAVVSEYPPDLKVYPYFFLRRNRIIAGLSGGVLVTEGCEDSGALTTARYALDNGRDIFAVPGTIQQPSMAGANRLIKRTEAKLVERVEDILNDRQMALSPEERPAVILTADDQRLLNALGTGGKTIDELSRTLKWNVSRLSEMLVDLCIKGRAREVGYEWIAL